MLWICPAESNCNFCTKAFVTLHCHQELPKPYCAFFFFKKKSIPFSWVQGRRHWKITMRKCYFSLSHSFLTPMQVFLSPSLFHLSSLGRRCFTPRDFCTCSMSVTPTASAGFIMVEVNQKFRKQAERTQVICSSVLLQKKEPIILIKKKKIRRQKESLNWCISGWPVVAHTQSQDVFYEENSYHRL